MKKLGIVSSLALAVILSGGITQIAYAGSTTNTFPTSGNVGVGITSPSRPLTIKATATPQHVISVLNPANTAEVVTMTVDNDGGGVLRMQNVSNVNKLALDADGNSWFLGGNLGIGTNSPSRLLTLKAPSDGQILVSVLNSGNTSEIFNVTSDAGGNGRFQVRDSSNTTQFEADGSTGDTYVGGTMSAAVVEIRGSGNDLAESFKVNNIGAQVTPGMIVSIDANNPGEMTLSATANDRKVAGIISGAGGLHAGIHLGDVQKASDGYHPVALTGRVWCRVASTSSPIFPGDMLTTSTVPGHAMKVDNFASAQGAIIGKAMTSVIEETGMVLVLVSLQ